MELCKPYLVIKKIEKENWEFTFGIYVIILKNDFSQKIQRVIRGV